MLIDIYTKKPGEPGYDEDLILDEDELSLLIAQIKMVLLTPKQSVLGNIDFGVDEESYLFRFESTVKLGQIQAEITQMLKDHCTLLFNRNFTVNVIKSRDGIDQYKEVIQAIITIDKITKFVISYE